MPVDLDLKHAERMLFTLVSISATADALGASPANVMVIFMDGTNVDGTLRRHKEVDAEVFSLSRPMLKPASDQRLPPVAIEGKMVEIFFAAADVRRVALVRDATMQEMPSGLVIAKPAIDFPGRPR